MAFCCGLVYARVGEGGGDLWRAERRQFSRSGFASTPACGSKVRALRGLFMARLKPCPFEGLVGDLKKPVARRGWVEGVGEVEGLGVLALRQAQGQDDRWCGWGARRPAIMVGRSDLGQEWGPSGDFGLRYCGRVPRP
jgi:hypothetical protein